MTLSYVQTLVASQTSTTVTGPPHMPMAANRGADGPDAPTSCTSCEAEALSKLALLRNEVHTLSQKQKQNERLLDSWRRNAATAASAAAIHEGLLTAEAWQLEHELSALQRARAFEDVQRLRALEAREAEATRTMQAATAHAQALSDEELRLRVRAQELDRREQLSREAPRTATHFFRRAPDRAILVQPCQVRSDRTVTGYSPQTAG